MCIACKQLQDKEKRWKYYNLPKMLQSIFLLLTTHLRVNAILYTTGLFLPILSLVQMESLRIFPL